MEQAPFRILGIPGSLRRASFNRGLLRAAQELAPEGVVVEWFDVGHLPFFNADLEAQGYPPEVQEFHQRLRAADALLLSSPEYNYNIPAVLKNAIEWASRPPRQSPLLRKPVAIMGAAVGQFGTVRMQHVLRQTLSETESYVMLKPEVLVNNARQKFDTDGNLHDEETRQAVRALLEALVRWAYRFQQSS